MQQLSDSLHPSTPLDTASADEASIPEETASAPGVVNSDAAATDTPVPTNTEAIAMLEDTLLRAVELHRDGHFEAAWAIYREILQIVPTHPDAMHLGGVVAFQVGEPDSALTLIQGAIQIAPHVPDYHSNLGEVLRSLDRYEEAEASYRRALHLDSEHKNAAAGLIEVAQVLARATA